jgi:hypothetical protein
MLRGVPVYVTVNAPAVDSIQSGQVRQLRPDVSPYYAFAIVLYLLWWPKWPLGVGRRRVPTSSSRVYPQWR